MTEGTRLADADADADRTHAEPPEETLAGWLGW